MSESTGLEQRVDEMLRVAPCPVSQALVAHRLQLDDDLDGMTASDVAHRALLDLQRAKKAVHVPHDKLASRWPPAAFVRVKSGDHDDVVQMSLGAWASSRNVARFDEIVAEAHLPVEKQSKLRPYLDCGWWGHLEPSPAFIEQAELSMKGYSRLLGY